MRLTYFGHSAFRIETAGTSLLIDPFLKQNPHGSVALESVPCEFVLCTHAHDDHSADALELALLHKATIIAPFELAGHYEAMGASTIDLMPGGGIDLPFGRVDMTPAIHSSSFELPGGKNLPMGVASGYKIRSEGKTIYHSGDTALFSDMSLIGRHGLDVALIPIGDSYTMGPADAIDALSLLKPKLAVPMHFNTFPKIRVDPDAFAAKALAAGHSVRVMKPGQTWELG